MDIKKLHNMTFDELALLMEENTDYQYRDEEDMIGAVKDYLDIGHLGWARDLLTKYCDTPNSSNYFGVSIYNKTDFFVIKNKGDIINRFGLKDVLSWE